MIKFIEIVKGEVEMPKIEYRRFELFPPQKTNKWKIFDNDAQKEIYSGKYEEASIICYNLNKKYYQMEGKQYTHTNGNIYTVLFLTNIDTENSKKYPVTVIYQGENGKRWSRELSDWNRSFTEIIKEKI